MKYSDNILYEYQNLLERMLDQAGDYINHNKIECSNIMEKANNDLVTGLDIEIGDYIFNEIKSHYPEHNVICEDRNETNVSIQNNKSSIMWIIDPIDGTTNLIHGFPFYTVSISCLDLYTGDYLVSGVYAPVLNLKFLAVGNTDASLNNKPICVSNNNNISSCLVLTGFSKTLNKKSKEFSSFIRSSIETRGTRRSGCASFDLCCVAAGWADAYYHYKLSVWDITAGFHLITNAGGRVEPELNLRMIRDKNIVLASNGLIHGNMKYLLRYG